MRKKRHPEHANHERWLVSYADFITLLFAFFVVMYAISQADLAKFRKVAESMQKAFKVSGGPAMVDQQGASGGPTVNPFETTEPRGGRVADMPAGKANTAAETDPELQEVRELLEQSISLDAGTATASDAIRMEYDRRGLVVSLAVKDVFAVGSVDVPEDIRPLIDSIGKVVTSSTRLIRIEGHADRGERESLGEYPSLWELSAARAGWVARYWLKRFPIEGKRIGVTGYADQRPLGDGRTEADRGRNRRVEIVILSSRGN